MEHETFDVLTKFLSFGLFVRHGGVSHKRIKASVTTCSDPEFLCWGGGGGGGGGWGGVQGRLLENSLNNVFFFFFISLFIVYRGGQIVYQWFYFRGNYFSQVSGGVSSLIQWVHHFPGGPAFSRVGDPNAIFNRNPYNL